MKAIKLPKSIYRHREKFQVSVWSKKYSKSFHVGYFDSISEAIAERDKYIIENYDDITYGYLPRGITIQKSKYFKAFLNVNGYEINIGSFENLNDAIEYRSSYIESLK